jgi:hypothetical protein
MGQGTGIALQSGSNRVENNHLYAFSTGIASSSFSDEIARNVMTVCTTPLSASGALVAPLATTAAQVAANASANMAQ